MSLLHPSNLAWALLAIPIIVFYILKIRLRRVPVSTILFWQQIFEQKQPRSIWQHLRHLLSLLVQLALLTLLVLALAEPFFRGEKQGARRLVLIVDNSASMNATDVSPSRLERAKAEGRSIVDALRFTDEMAVIAAGTEPQVICGMTDHQKTLRDALGAIPPTDGPTRIKEAVELARRLLADAKNRRIIILSDACFEDAAQLARAEEVELRTVGKRADNAGITRFQVRRSLVDPIGYEILAEVANLSAKPLECRIDIDLNGDPVDVVPLKLEPGGRWSQTFEKISAEGGHLVAQLKKDNRPLADALAADNQAWALLPRRAPQRVTLVTEGNWFLRKVFEAIPLVQLTVTRAIPETSAPGITVFHRKTPKTLPAGPVLVIEPSESSDLWEVGLKLQNPVVAQQAKDSPLMAHVRLDNVLMPEARQIRFSGKAQVLAASASGDPIYAVIDRPEGKVAVLTVDLDKGDLPLQTAFPILMTNALAWYAGTKGELRESIAAGGLVEVELPASLRSKGDLVLRSPAGTARPLPREATKITIGPLDRCGIWEIAPKPTEKAAEGVEARPPAELEIACNLNNRDESDLRAPEGLKAPQQASLGGFGGRPLWYYLIACAWLLIAVEWFLYQRRWIS
ncbi:MAG: BatA and WFA domain-containing protein [Isosphaeraceae bacterium]|nr:BatA and WFA domain-containing protein [Isosphaeraceae bacterium]